MISKKLILPVFASNEVRNTPLNISINKNHYLPELIKLRKKYT